MRLLAALVALTMASASCASTSSTRVHLLRSTGVPIVLTPSGAIPLEVVTRGSGVRDPLPVTGTSITYGDIEPALGMAISSAAGPWAESHRAKAGDAWQLQVELIQADAEYKDDRLIVTFGVRATLRARVGNRYIAQTQASCKQAGLISVEEGGPVVYACMNRIGRDLSGWLGGIETS